MKIKAALKFFLTGAFMLMAGHLMAQSAEIVKEKKIVSTTVYEYFVEEGLDEPAIESVENFNDQGQLLEIKEYDNKGSVKRWEKYVYNEEGKVEEEIFLDSKGRVDSREKTIYADGLRVEKQFYNNKDKLVKRKVYEYEYQD
jgi:hypothetical protein